MYDYINLEDELQGRDNEVEIIAQREISHNEELFMIICLEHDKTKGYYQTSYTYCTTNQVLKRSNKTYKLLYAVYFNKEDALKVFNDFTLLDEDIIIHTEQLEDL